MTLFHCSPGRSHEKGLTVYIKFDIICFKFSVGSVNCDFELSNICSYVASSNFAWSQASINNFPDHTFGNLSGKYLP